MATKANPPGAIRPVSTATLIKRLRRFYAAQHQTFHVARTERERQLWGPFYVTCGRYNAIVDQLPYLEPAARERGVLKPEEILVDPPIVRCKNCGAVADPQWLNAMRANGFELHHLACKSCGQHSLKRDEEGGRHE